MVSEIPKGLYDMETRYAIIKKNGARYRQSSKKIKKQMLDEMVEILHMNRQYIAYLLRNTGRKVVIRDKGIVLVGEYSDKLLSQRGRKKIYTEDVEKALAKVWAISGFISSKHLVHFIRLNRDILFSHRELSGLEKETKAKLEKVSAATIDRILKRYRDIWRLKKRYKGNPFSSNLKRSIQVESWFDRGKEVGSLEIDLVHHCGEKADGQFIYTLTATEITTGWTELIPLRNKAMVWTMGALEKVVKDIPVKVRKIHSDNGSEFINSYVKRFCESRDIEFRRSRPYRKNDAPYVESKNWSMVRGYTGWRRYDTEEQYQILKKLTRLISLKHNLFIPQMKVIEKIRMNGKVKKRYQIDTPLNRVLRLEGIEDKIKKELLEKRSRIDMVRLTKAIEYLKEKLEKTYLTKKEKEKCLTEI